MEGAARTTDSIVQRTCTNCGTALMGQYCYQCGQRRIDDPLSLKALAGELAANIVDIERSKMWRSIRALVIRPGLLTTEYLSGHRADWITPIKLYVSIFAVSFFLYSAFKSVAVYDLSTLLTIEKSGALARGVAQLAQKKHLTTDAFIALVNARWHTYMSAAQFIYPFIFAVILKLFYLYRRFVEHLVFSTHYQALALLITIVAWPLYRLTGLALTHTSAVLAVLVTLVMILYLLFAIRAVYRQSWPVSIVKGVLLYFGYYVIYTATTYSMLGLAIVAEMRSS